MLKPVYVRATGLVAPVTMRLSRWYGGYLPSGTALTMEQAVSSSGRCIVVREREIVIRPPFEGFPGDLTPLEPATDTPAPRVAVAELPDGRVLGPHRAVITSSGDLLEEVGAYFGTNRLHQHPLFMNPFPGKPHHCSGRLGVLATRGDRNYYHFLIEALPRIWVLEQRPEIAPPDLWYVPATTRFQQELLDLMGITAAGRIDSDIYPHVQADCLVVPGLASLAGENPPSVVDFLRARLLGRASQGGGRRVYVARSAGANNRRVVNEDEMLALLRGRGFEVVDPGRMSVREQIACFASASVVVSPHGAALANLVFSPPGALVVELFPAGCVLPDYWRLASSGGLKYRYLASGRPPKRSLRRNVALISDIEVDVPALATLLDEDGR